MKIARIVLGSLSAALFFAITIIGLTTVDSVQFTHMMIIGIVMSVAMVLLGLGFSKPAGIITLATAGIWCFYSIFGLSDPSSIYISISRYSYGFESLSFFNLFYAFYICAGLILAGLSILIPKMKWASISLPAVYLMFTIFNYAFGESLYFYHRSYGHLYDRWSGYGYTVLEADLRYGHFWTVLVIFLAYGVLAAAAIMASFAPKRQKYAPYGMYGQPQYPQYGQPQYGQPQYPQYGQPQYPQQTPYGQPQYPQQAPYGQPQYPQQAPYGQPQAPNPFEQQNQNLW